MGEAADLSVGHINREAVKEALIAGNFIKLNACTLRLKAEAVLLSADALGTQQAWFTFQLDEPAARGAGLGVTPRSLATWPPL
ncbi:hypothetical protein [Deinococcus radiophilus]|uniref:hypothetical protein n=1 Tax=Deinococcus radiophilus TaxID=32062 RepID=UPI003606E894